MALCLEVSRLVGKKHANEAASAIHNVPILLTKKFQDPETVNYKAWSPECVALAVAVGIA